MYYNSLAKDEEEKEQKRITLPSSTMQKIKSLHGINNNSNSNNNTGKLHTTQGKTSMKALAQEYGLAFAAIWTGVWCFTGVLTYGAIELGGVDAVALVAKADSFTGYDFSSKIDPTYGKIGVAIVLNELMEPLRFPFTVSITKPIVDAFRNRT
eukprot:CAMPEP_0203672406 /NCGR_PEP_ID=MMETSP0090-20130426/8389_1 /ASSEMBLY_ACC=CAM_ASM_001088 /TAXON_ID=426623 /ORGANISM="Chaetoceros affinis, Strain CCMP159" /LENGTH=152 /DNA_ID=CAMNT_0050537717 /DNA_START=172 /DNA_END=630 /DNA_ORIENTATION=+